MKEIIVKHIISEEHYLAAIRELIIKRDYMKIDIPKILPKKLILDCLKENLYWNGNSVNDWFDWQSFIDPKDPNLTIIINNSIQIYNIHFKKDDLYYNVESFEKNI